MTQVRVPHPKFLDANERALGNALVKMVREACKTQGIKRSITLRMMVRWARIGMLTEAASVAHSAGVPIDQIRTMCALAGIKPPRYMAHPDNEREPHE